MTLANNIIGADITTLKGVVIPDAFKQPDWVESSFSNFEKIVKTDFNKNKVLNSALVRKAFKEYILDNKISPPYPLNKSNVGKLLEKLYNVFGDEEFQWRYMLIYRVGFFLSSLVSISFTPDSLTLPTQFKKKRLKIIDEYKKKIEDSSNQQDKEKAIMWVDKNFKSLTSEVLTYFRENREIYPIVDSIDSGAKGGNDDLRKLLVAIGLSINAKGEINDVIERSGSEGLTPTQFFNYTSQAIVSQYKKSSETAAPGYLIRQLNTIMTGVKLSKIIDCKTKGRLNVHILNKDMLKSMSGKLYDGGVISPSDTDLIGKSIKLRSSLYCKAQDGICHSCYNPAFIEKMNLTTNAGIGLLSSTAQAGLLTNMTLKAAHTGLSLDKSEIDLTNDIFEYSE
jgi:DNA-directed RNA polymerase subunit beta'